MSAAAPDPRSSRLWLIPSPRAALRRVLRELRERLAPSAAAAEVEEGARFPLLWEREFYLPPELVRLVASFAPAAVKVAMERACREWKEAVLPRHWVADLRRTFGLDYMSLRAAGRPEPKRLFALLTTSRRELVGGRRGAPPAWALL